MTPAPSSIEHPAGEGMTTLAVAFRLATGRPICCYMCQHCVASETSLCNIGKYTTAWSRMWKAMEGMPNKVDLSVRHHSAAEFCTYFKPNMEELVTKREAIVLTRLTKA